VYETYQEGSPNSHNEDTCLTCQYHNESEEQSPTVGVEDSPLPLHSDYEDDFAAAGLGRPSYGDDEEDTYDTTCIGIRDIIFTGAVRHFFYCFPAPRAHRSLFGRPILITAWLGGGLRSLAACVHGMACLHSCVSRYVVSVSSGRVIEDHIRVLIRRFRSLTRPDGDDRNGSSEATSTMGKFSLAAGAT
jgi:hypothetical protein